MPHHHLHPDAVTAHLDRLYRAAWAMCGNPHDAEDLVQDTCLRVLAKPRRVTRGDELGYLLTALRNTHINRYRATSRRPQTVHLGTEDGSDVELPDERPSAGTVEQASAREVLGWVNALPDAARQAVIAIDIVGLTRTEAASSLGVSERAVAEQLHRGRHAVASRLCREAVPA